MSNFSESFGSPVNAALSGVDVQPQSLEKAHDFPSSKLEFPLGVTTQQKVVYVADVRQLLMVTVQKLIERIQVHIREKL